MQKPEKLVEQEILHYLNINTQIKVDVIDSKATFSQRSQSYKKSKAAPIGFPDLVGNDEHGRAFYIELKAKGKLRTIRPAQRKFLLRKIQDNCFAACVDSVACFERIYLSWLASGKSKVVLLEELDRLPSASVRPALQLNP